MQEYGLICRTKEAVSSDAYQEIFRGRLVPAGTLLMSFKLTIGRVSILGIHAFHNEAIISIYPKSEVDRDFLMFYLPTINFSDHQDRAVKGNTLNKSKINELPIPLPPLSEQRAIARALRTVQEAKEARQRELELERERKAALMQHLFTHGTRGEPLKETEIGLMPESWRVVRLGELFDVQQGKALSVKSRQGSNPKPFLRTANVLWGRLDLSTLDQMDFTPDECNKLELRPGDLLVCEGGEIGRTAMWNGELPDCYYQNHLHRLRRKQDTAVVPEFFMYWMQAAMLIFKHYEGYGNKTTIPNLSGARLKAFLLPVPPIAEQEEIAEVLQQCDAKQDALQNEILLLEELFKTMLEELMTGRLSALPLVEGETPP
jgi:type I restriction enzyme S subunit